MRTIRIKLYKFEELSAEAQNVAIESNRRINVDYGDDWWKTIYEDAEAIGCEISGFELGRYCDLEILRGYQETAKSIMENHGDTTATYTAAKLFMEGLQAVDEDDEQSEENEFIKFRERLSRAYLKLLDNNYEYLTSDKAIKETIVSNEYEFTKDGKMY